MNEPQLDRPPLPLKDRTTGLRIFGVLTILLGCLCGLFVLLMILGQVMSAQTTGTPANFQAVIPSIGVYVLLAVVLVWLGIGSIMARRWARALLLMFSWTWLILGIVSLILMALFLPLLLGNMQMDLPSGQTAMSSGIKAMVMVISLGVVAVFFVALPIVWILFYRSLHVKQTCEMRNPVPGWTDACPLPVLNISLWLAISAVMLLLMPLSCRGVFPFFGTFLTGWPGTMVYFVFAASMGYSAYAMYRLEVGGWWLNFVSFVVLLIANVATYARHDLMEFYRLAGYPDQQIEQLQQFTASSGNWMVWGTLLFMLPFLGYFVYLKKFFRPAR